MNETEIRLGTVARQKASNDDVKAFGKMMADDHAMLQQELTAVAAQNRASVPKTVDNADQRLIDRIGEAQRL